MNGPSPYISLSEAGRASGYSAEYLRQLCVKGRLEGHKIGNSWVTTSEAVSKLKAGVPAPVSLSSEVSLSEAGKLSGYSAEYLRQLCVKGVIQGHKIGSSWITTLGAVKAFKQKQIPFGSTLPEISGMSVFSFSKLQGLTGLAVGLMVFIPVVSNLTNFTDKFATLTDKTNQIVVTTQTTINEKIKEYIRSQFVQSGVVSGNNTTPQVEAQVKPVQPQVLGINISDTEVLEAVRAIMFNETLSAELVAKFKGERGESGEDGKDGVNGIDGTPGGTTVQYIPNSGSVFGTTAPTAQQGHVGTIGSATYLSARDFQTETINVSSTSSLSGTNITGDLNITGNQTNTGNLTITGTQTNTGNFVITGDIDLTGQLLVTGNSTFTGHLYPGTDNLFNIGSSTMRWNQVNVGPTGLIVRNDATDTNKVSLIFSGSTAKLGTDTATPLQLTTGANAGINVLTTGRVGINTTNPTTDLQLNQSSLGSALEIRRFSDGTPTGNLIKITDTTGLTPFFVVSAQGDTTIDGDFTQNGGTDFTTSTGAFNFWNTAINFNATNPVLDLSSASTLSINTTTNRPITTGTGLVTLGGNLTVNGTGVTLASGTIVDTLGGTLSLNTTTNRPITTGTGLVTLGGDLTITGDNVILASGSTIDTLGGTLSINTTTNRPVTFGTGMVTIPNLTVTNSQSNNGTMVIDSAATTATIFQVTGTSLTSGTAIGKTITANAGNGQTTKGEILTLTDSTVAGGGFTGIGITVTGAGVGSGNKYLLSLNPNTANNEVVFDNTGSFRPTTSVASNTATLGSPSFYWKNGYFDQITANNLSGTVVTGATSSTTWTIGSTEAGDVNEAIIFQRNSGSGNATLQWNAGAGDLRYLSVNYPFNNTYTVDDTSIGTGINLLSSNLTNNTTAGTQKLLSLTNTGTGTTETGIYINNTGTATTAFEIAGTWTNGIVTNNNTINAGTGALTAGTTTIDNLILGGGYGSTGVTISNTGNISANGNLIIDGTITSGLINGQTISSTANFTGTSAFATSISIAGGTALTTTNQTGTGNLVLANTPTLITPVLGVATATSITIGANTLDTNEWAFLDGLNQTLATTSSPTFAGLTNSALTSGRVTFASTAGLLVDDADLTFATDTLSATKLLSSTSVSTPSLISTGAITMTPASGSNLNISLATTGDLVVNTDDLVVDTSSGFVGIGTNAPSSIAEVYGTSPMIEVTDSVIAISNYLGATSGNFQMATNRHPVTGVFSDVSKASALVNLFAGSSDSYISFYTSPTNNDIGGERWRITKDGHFIAGTDNTYDIGASGATRPRTGYFGTSVVVPTLNATTAIQLNGTSINTAGTLSNVAYLDAANTFTNATPILANATIAGAHYIDVRNSSNDPSASSRIRVGNSTSVEGLMIQAFVSGHALYSNRGRVASELSGGIDIAAQHATSDLRFYNRGNTLALTLGASQAATFVGTVATPNVITPSITTASGALTITPAAGSNLNVNLSTTGDLVVNTDDFVVDTSTGWVGIGTATPGVPLTVSAGAFVNSIMNVSAAFNAGANSLQVGDDGTDAVIGVGNSSTKLHLLSRVAGVYTRTFTLDSAGSVGIGTTTPSSKLDITTAGLATTQTTTSGLALVNTTAATAIAPVQISPATRWSGFGWKTDATAASQAVDFRAFVTPVQGTANPTGYLGFGSSINGGAYSDNQLVLTSAGNVGIGTATPAKQLEVYGTSAVMQINDDDNPIIILNKRNTTARNFYIQASGDILSIGNNGAQSFNVDNNGNVGIGTTGPGSKLQINYSGGTQTEDGAASTLNGMQIRGLTDTVGAGASLRFFAGNGTKETGAMIGVANTSGANGDIQISTYAGGTAYVERLRITAGGNVGIGTTNPLEKFHLEGAAGAPSLTAESGLFNLAGTSTTSLKMGIQAGGSGPWIQATNTPATGTGAYNLSIQPLGGNVGIGTTNPGALLSIGANSYINSGQTYDGANGWAGTRTATTWSDGTRRGSIQVSAANGGMAFGTETAHQLDLFTNQTIALTILSGGNVGIGTTVPGVKLDVQDTTAGNASIIKVRNDQSDQSSLMAYGSTFAGTIFGLNKARLSELRLDGTSGGLIDTGGSAKLYLTAGAVGNDPAITIDTSGNVGIGTTGPVSALDVATTLTANYGVYLRPTFTSDTNFGAGIEIRPTVNATGTGTLSAFQVDPVLNLTGTGIMNHALITTASFLAETITQGDDTITNTATVYISGANTATVSGVNYALKIDSGTVALGTGNVGIGTTGPGAALQVNSSSASRVAIFKNPAAAWATESNLLLTTGDPDQGQGSIAWLNRDVGATYPSQLQFRTIASNAEPTVKMVVTGAGNVGIGTTAPVNKFSITGSPDAPSITAASGLFRLDSVTTTGFSMGIQSAAPYGTYLQSTNTPATGGGAYPLLLNPLGGNVGIGTTGPNYKLDISSSAASDRGINVIVTGTGTSAAGLFQATGAGTINYGLFAQASGATTNYSFWGGAGTLYNAGSVGIGTTSLGGNVFITRVSTGGTDPTESVGAFVLGDSATYQGILRVKNAGNRGTLGHASGSPLILAEFSDATAMVLDKNGNLLVGTSNSDVGGSVTGIRLSAAGGMMASIDTADSATAGVLHLDRRGTNNVGGVIAFDMGGYIKSVIGVLGTNGSTDDGGFTFSTVSANATKTERMRIQANGNVGIGTSNPLAKLQVGSFAMAGGDVPTAGPATMTLNVNSAGATTAGDQGYQMTLLESSALGANKGGALGFQAVYDGSNNITTIAGIKGLRENATASNHAGYLSLLTRTGAGTIAEKMRITSAGNVGIGTTVPGLKLDVAGTAGGPATSGTAQTGVFRIQARPTTSVTLDMGIYSSSPYGGWIQSTDDADLSVEYPLILQPNGGNVGIGTTSPADFKLQVAGAIGPSVNHTYDFGSSAKHYGCLYYSSDGGGTGGSIGTCVSDARLKDQIQPIVYDQALIKVVGLQPKRFHFISDPEGSMSEGFIAQEVLTVAPELVDTGSDGYYKVNYGKLPYMLLAAVQELDRKTSGYYPAGDVATGDIVALQATVSGVVKATADNTPMGIVKQVTANTARVEYVGRIQVKVSEENGAINPGDKLMVSSLLPGYATKMTISGNTIGTALEASNGGVEGLDTIEVSVSLGYHQIHVAQSEATGQIFTVDSTYDFNNNSLINVKTIASMNGSWSISEDGRLVVREIQTEKLCIGQTCVDEPTLVQLLQNAGLSGQQSTSTSGGSSTTGDSGVVSGETQPTPVTEPVPEPTPEPSPTPVTEPVPEPAPELTPIPEV